MKTIEPSQSELAWSIVFGPKKDDSLPFLIDCRKLRAVNVKTIRQFWVLENRDWRPRQEQHDIFIAPRTVQIFKMPFNLNNASSTFQRFMNFILSTAKWEFAL